MAGERHEWCGTPIWAAVNVGCINVGCINVCDGDATMIYLFYIFLFGHVQETPHPSFYVDWISFFQDDVSVGKMQGECAISPPYFFKLHWVSSASIVASCGSIELNVLNVSIVFFTSLTAEGAFRWSLQIISLNHEFSRSPISLLGLCPVWKCEIFFLSCLDLE